jgi:ribose 5-phosphate isomerase B
MGRINIVAYCCPYSLDFVCSHRSTDSTFAKPLAKSVSSGETDRGIMVCGSGVGASVAANKVKGVRAAVCHDIYSAHQGVEHDNMNILCLGSRIVGTEVVRELVSAFISAEYTNEERHARRLNKVIEMENDFR